MRGLNTILTVISLPALAATSYAQSGRAARGKYLTEEVAHCQVCHTARLNSGELDRSAWLKGAANAPDITAGGALWSVWFEKGMARFLETGADPAGKGAAAHMPAYRLRRDDAEAIAAYLKTLK